MAKRVTVRRSNGRGSQCAIISVISHDRRRVLSALEPRTSHLRKWGERVATCLIDDLQPLIAPISTELFVKLPIKPRLKTGGSFVTKAFYNTKRKKPYSNPYEEITDKVGVRIVVLLPT
ncbi:hypothetical protein ACVWZR_002390 [Bradyrhizobium sp. i1.3.1]